MTFEDLAGQDLPIEIAEGNAGVAKFSALETGAFFYPRTGSIEVPKAPSEEDEDEEARIRRRGLRK